MAFFSTISISQYIIVGLVVLITAGGFLEATAHEEHRFTAGRVLAALGLPTFWILFTLLPWGRWIYLLDAWVSTTTHHSIVLDVLFIALTFVCIVAVLIIGVPIIFVGSLVVWVGAALTGTLPQEIASMRQGISASLRRLFKRQPNNTTRE